MSEARQNAVRASTWVVRHLDLFAPGGEVLDVACGSGRHLAAGLGAGLRMVGLDRDLSAARVLEAGSGGRLTLIEADLEGGGPWPPGERRFDGVIVTNYLWRPLLPRIVSSVGLAGALIYETFAVGNERLGRPRNPEFLLRPGELIEAVRPNLLILAYEHGRLSEPERIVQRIAAIGPLHPLAAELEPGR